MKFMTIDKITTKSTSQPRDALNKPSNSNKGLTESHRQQKWLRLSVSCFYVNLHCP